MPYAVIGIDVGGTRTKGVALSTGGAILAEKTRPTTRAEASAHLGPDVGALAASLTTGLDRPVRRVGVAVPGLVDEDKRLGIWSANLGWRDLDLTATFGPHVSAPVTIGHDVRSGLVGEHRLGAARGQDNTCFVPLGTGLAAAVLSSGRVVRGGAWTGEIGHVVVDPTGEICGCGRRGCVETLIGAAGLVRCWKRFTGEDVDAAHVVRRAADRDPVATEIWGRGVAALAATLAPVLSATGVEHVVIGGGLSRAGDVLLTPLTQGLRERLGKHEVQVVEAMLGDRAGALGAGLLALDAAEEGT